MEQDGAVRGGRGEDRLYAELKERRRLWVVVVVSFDDVLTSRVPLHVRETGIKVNVI